MKYKQIILKIEETEQARYDRLTKAIAKKEKKIRPKQKTIKLTIEEFQFLWENLEY